MFCTFFEVLYLFGIILEEIRFFKFIIECFLVFLIEILEDVFAEALDFPYDIPVFVLVDILTHIGNNPLEQFVAIV